MSLLCEGQLIRPLSLSLSFELKVPAARLRRPRQMCAWGRLGRASRSEFNSRTSTISAMTGDDTPTIFAETSNAGDMEVKKLRPVSSCARPSLITRDARADCFGLRSSTKCLLTGISS